MFSLEAFYYFPMAFLSYDFSYAFGTQVKRYFKHLIAIAATIIALTRPLPVSAEITLRNLNDFYITRANVDLVNQAIYRLAGDPRLANHPIRAYLYDPNLKSEIIFSSILAGEGALAMGSNIAIRHEETKAHYVRMLAHEFIHVAMADKYVGGPNYSFLRPEDFAFRQLMEESFAQSVHFWAYLSYPDIMPNNRQVRNWERQPNPFLMADAKRNDYRALHPNHSEDQINAMVAADMLNLYMTLLNEYTLQEVPNIMMGLYGHGTTFLISEYAPYAARGDGLLRHQWNYLLSMMPEPMQQVMRANNQTYDHYRARFRSDMAAWARHAVSPEQSILYWVNFDYMNPGRNRMSNFRMTPTENRRYWFLSEDCETRLNRVMREIDPFFTPVSTARNPINVWQWSEHHQGR